MSVLKQDKFTCPHCEETGPLKVWGSVNVTQDPDARRQLENLSLFEWTCPNCGKTCLVLHPCMYHDMDNEFMVWFAPDDEKIEDIAEFSQLDHYKLRTVHTPNEFREKVNILERGLDDRAIELTKLIIIMQITRDGGDIVDLVFHSIDSRGQFVFVIVHPDGVEQYLKLPAETYQKFANDAREYLYTPSRGFQTIDLAWAKDSLELLQGLR